MRTALKSLLPVAVVILVAGLMKCAISPSKPSNGTCGGSGTGSECGFNIYATLHETSGNPAKNIPVTLRPREYLPIQRPLARNIVDNGYAAIICSTTTDSKGFYSFKKEDSIPAGVYCIEARNSKSGNCLFIDSIVIDSQLLNSDTGLEIRSPYVKTDNTLKPPGSISGTIQLTDSIDGGIVFVYGLNTSALIHPDGSFKIENLPAGNLRLNIIVSQSENQNVCSLAVTTVAGTPTLLDTMYGVFYNGNRNTGGPIPSANSLFSLGDTVIILGDIGTIEKSDSIFIGWNTRADGSGVWYDPGDTLIIDTAARELYAQWASQKHNLTTISSGNGTVNGSDTVAHGVPHAITAAPDSGNHFSFWRVTSGKATIADSFAASTTVILEHGDATVEGVFGPGKVILTTGNNLILTDIQPTLDNGYIILGDYETFSTTHFNDIRLIKINSNGNPIWTRTFEGPGLDAGASVRQTNDGGYIIAGTICDDSDCDIYVIKTDARGDTIWTNTYGGAGTDRGYSARQTIDGGYVIAGSISHSGAQNDSTSAYLIKTDSGGKTVWTKTYGENYIAQGYSVEQTNDSGYIVIGSIEMQVYLVKTMANGDTVWTRKFDRNQNFGNTYVNIAPDGGFIVVYAASSIYITRTNADGVAMLTKNFEVPDCGKSDPSSIQLDRDGGYIIAGNNTMKGSCYDAYLIKTDQGGNILWTKSYANIMQNIAFAIETDDGGYHFIGGDNTKGDLLLVKTDEKGNIATKW